MSRATVLLVEDDPNYALLLGFAFREHSLDVHLRQVCDGHTAIAYLQGRGRYSNRNVYSLPGLIVLDLHVPGVGGGAVLRWIRKQPWLAGLPVVLLNENDGAALGEEITSGTETVTIKRRDTKGLIYLLENVNLNWATTSKGFLELRRCSAIKYSSRSVRTCRALRSRSAISSCSNDRNGDALNSRSAAAV